MRILVDCHCFDYVTSEGVNTHIRGLYSAVLRQAPEDWEFYFVCKYPEKLTWAGYGADADSDFSNEVISSRIHFIRLSDRGKWHRLLVEYPKIIRKNHIDYAHFQYTAPPFAFMLGKRGTLGGRCRTVVTLHDILFKDFTKYFPLKYKLVKGALFYLTAKRADLLLTVSEYSKSRISHHFGIPADEVFVTPNAVTRDFWEIDAGQARAFVSAQGVRKYILCVSRFEPRKRQTLLLKTYLEMRLWEQGYDVVFIGRKTLSMPEFDRLLMTMPEEARPHVFVHYHAPYKELKLWYKAASLFVYPAVAEGFGIPPIEAGAAQVPCICSNRTAMGDFKFFAENHIDCDDADLLKGRIRAILGLEGALQTPPVAEISEEIAKVYNWDVVARRLIDHISEDAASISSRRGR